MSRILLVSYFSPSRGHAGGLRLLDLYREIKRISPATHLSLLTGEHADADWGVEEVDAIFDEIHRVAPADFNHTALARVDGDLNFDVIDFQYHQAGALLAASRRRWPEARLIYSPMESLLRGAVLALDGKALLHGCGWRRFASSIWQGLKEARYIRQADRVVAVSIPDQLAMSWLREKNVFCCIPTCLSSLEFSASHAVHHMVPDVTPPTIVFVAYFGSQTNRDALRWYCQEVHPEVRLRMPAYRLLVVGRGQDEALRSVCSAEGVDFLGEVTSIGDTLQVANIGIAPALSGAGVRGKVHQYAAAALPCVASRIACEGLEYVPGSSILLADDAGQFAQYCLSLLEDPAASHQMGSAAQAICLQHYTWQTVHAAISDVYKLTSKLKQ